MDLDGKDTAGNGGGGDEERVVAVHDLEQPLGHQEQPAADRVGRGLAIGHLIREVSSMHQ